MIDVITVIVFSYILGSIPFGLILTKLFTNQDIRKIGSGNIGATNVLRTGNKFLAIGTLILDVAKGYIAAMISINYFSELVLLSCFVVFLGHLFPAWLKFNGGKGVATYLGILLALSYQLSFLFIFTWLMIALIFKYSSISSMFASLTVFITNIIREMVTPFFLETNLLIPSSLNNFSFLLFIFFILIIFTHRKNISNLKNKVEQKIKI